MVGPYEGKASSQQAIMQSSHITEDLFRKFNRFEQREMQGLLDYSKEAWVSGKKAMYVMPDNQIDMFELEAEDHMESEYGIFVSDAGRDLEKLDQAKQLSQAMIQNGMKTSEVLELFDTENFTGIKAKIAKAERAREALEQKQQEAQQQQQQQEMQLKQQALQQEQLEKDKDRQIQIETALIHAEANDSTGKLNLDLEKMLKEHEVKQRELSIKEKEINQKNDAQ